STFSSAGAAVLANFFGTDNVTFTTGSDTLPGVTRTFPSFSAAAAEAGQARIYGGIHIQVDNQDALIGGHALGNYVSENFLTPIEENVGEHGHAAPAGHSTRVNDAGVSFIPALGTAVISEGTVAVSAAGSGIGHVVRQSPGADDVIVAAGNRKAD